MKAAILKWCKAVTEGYEGVAVVDLKHSFVDGLALCAILNRFRPDLVDFDSLNPSDSLENCRKAFSAMEEIGAIVYMDPEDLAGHEDVDEKCMMLQVSELQKMFGGEEIPKREVKREVKSEVQESQRKVDDNSVKRTASKVYGEVKKPDDLLKPSPEAEKCIELINANCEPPKPEKQPLTLPIPMLQQLLQPTDAPKNLSEIINDFVRTPFVLA